MYGLKFLSALYLLFYLFNFGFSERLRDWESLTPYGPFSHGSHLSHRQIRECHPPLYDNVTSIEVPSHKDSSHLDEIVELRTIGTWLASPKEKHYFRGHYAKISNPELTVSVLEPGGPGGCALRQRITVLETAKSHHCLVAINAGYFNTSSGACLGNVISNGIKVQDNKGIQNAHFGIKKNGNLFFGYLPQNAVSSEVFSQLVGGVVWIRRNGTSFLDISRKLECSDTEETGSMDRFLKVQSARTIVGSDKFGKLILLQVDGKTDVDGLSLWEMDELLEKLGVVNAINLDGGGSATFVVNSTLVNYPSDPCEENVEESVFRCPRSVSTVICVHHPLSSSIQTTSESTPSSTLSSFHISSNLNDTQISNQGKTLEMVSHKPFRLPFIVVTIIASLSLAANLLFIFLRCSCHVAPNNSSSILNRRKLSRHLLLSEDDAHTPMLMESNNI